MTLDAENKILREALESIIAYQIQMGGAVFEYSVTAIIARQAIKKTTPHNIT